MQKNKKLKSFFDFVSKGNLIKSIIALVVKLPLFFFFFLKENATVFSCPFILRTEKDQQK